MLFVMALFVWFALSIPATLILARIIGGAGSRAVSPPARRVAMSGHAARP
jgi:hypothetical protein